MSYNQTLHIASKQSSSGDASYVIKLIITLAVGSAFAGFMSWVVLLM